MHYQSDLDLTELFARAVELDDERRRELLNDLDARNPALAAELRSLLTADSDEGHLPHEPVERELPESLAVAALQRDESEETLDETLEQLRRLSPSSGRYEPGEELGHGAMGVVRKARDHALRRTLAMKTLRARFATGEGTASSFVRFVEEARVTGQLEHPGIVPVHDIGVDAEGNVFFTMQRVRGRDLKAVLELARDETEGWSRTRVLGVLLRVCEAMAYAHAKGVLHRDLKPANIMVGRFGEVYVMDWGVARVSGEVDRHDLRIKRPTATVTEAIDSPVMTMDGLVVGTPYYMSPEQALGRREGIDERSDVYAVGAMLYQLLAGREPYREEEESTPNQVLLRVVQSRPERLGRLAPSAPPELVAICDKAMARDPERRYADMGELAEDFRAFLEERVVSAHATGAFAEMRKWVRRNRTAASLGSLLALFVVTSLAGFSYAEARSSAKLADKNLELEAEALKANSIKGFLIELLSSADPSKGNRPDLKVADILGGSEQRLEVELADQPEIRLELHEVIARAYHVLGLGSKMTVHQERALALREELYPGDDAGKAKLMMNLADNGVIMPRTDADLQADIALVSAALEMAARLPDPERSDLIKDGRGTLVALQIKAGVRDDVFFEYAVGFLHSMADEQYSLDEVREYLTRLPHRVGAAWEAGDLAQIRSILREHAQRYVEDPNWGFQVSIAFSRYAEYLMETGHHSAAAGMLHEAEMIAEEFYTPDSPGLANMRCALAKRHATAGRPAKAAELYREALAHYTEYTGATSVQALRTRMSLAGALTAAGLPEAADEIERACLALVRSELEPDDKGYVIVVLACAEAALEGNPERTRQLCQECLPHLEARSRRGSLELARTRLLLARALMRLEEAEQAEAELMAAREWAEARTSQTRAELREEVLDALDELYSTTRDDRALDQLRKERGDG